MTKAEAHTILDAAKRGEPISEAEIADALRTTGDIEWGESVHIYRPSGTWEIYRSHA